MPKAISEIPSSGQDMARFTKQTILGATFEATERYTQLVPIEFGTSGLSCAARDQICNQNVAVKKLTGVFKTEATAKRMFGEIKLLKQLRHENITNLLDIFMAPSEDIYLVTDLMSTDLHTLLKSMKLEGQFVQFFTYQIMRGLKYVHSVGVVHRDLKPSSILVNENCDLKICDFGLTKETQVTDYASTGYYRAPETMLPWREYTEKADVWSAGCIFAEMITGNTLFPGKNHIDQIRVIAQWLGNPPKDFPANVINQKTLNFIHSLPKREPNPLSNFIPGAEANATALLGEMLQIDPRKRVSAANALTSQYFAPYQDVADESTATKVFDWTFLEANLPVDIWKTVLYAEVFGYHASHTQGGSED
ncbi:hypothetical protein N7499_003596 [Penicillium canescens]|uniref:mitogen-activated protein kinase n=1 Tax=Penicillium canescens TaxID=5083 RepID=A0AAD6IA04_PENCN|nr:uncharacterized protein N7446_012535 [Penicillium canescens]KAJ6020313.1 hypothetical protein N7522_000388 [Penicillium canescens]KAJ6038727.1 hypothetical protein N7460_007444 [Penicillium canescens]KAJ6045671.1 hypothetical protein N7446_012535 [Penicillium canescens]KAJ6066267.1 hypothetical protein N7444_000020 [Penicillium canescens]KAJ6090882.1 hypothetical protein N7499_003596 [Penicillium canescens]